jgi:SM-20-related protein
VATVAMLRDELLAAGGSPATVLGSHGEERRAFSGRQATQVTVSRVARAAVVELLEAQRAPLAQRFGRRLDSFEEPQFLRYGPGDHFVAHQDGNTPLVHDASRFRRVSVVLFLAERTHAPVPGAYGGGMLVLHDRMFAADRQVALAPPPGTLVAYPSETTHEVLPITHGRRLTVVSWYRCDED